MLQDVSDKLSQIKSNFPPDINTETDSWMLWNEIVGIFWFVIDPKSYQISHPRGKDGKILLFSW